MSICCLAIASFTLTGSLAGCGNSADPTATAAPGVQPPANTGPPPVAAPMHSGSGAMRGMQQMKGAPPK